MRKADEIATRAGTGLAPRRSRIARTTPAPVLPRRPTVRTVRGWLREILTSAPPLSYLAPGERCLVETRLHWLVPLTATIRAAGGMALMTAAGMVLVAVAPGWLLPKLAICLAAVAHSAWMFYRVLRWRTETIIVTDKRIIRVSGIFVITVDAVQLDQITDSTLRCSLPGRVLGYGAIRVESAGQRQAVERLDYLPGAAAVYRATLGVLSGP